METTLARITLNFGTAELALARQIKALAGERGVNRLVKQALREYLERHQKHS